MDIKEHKLKQFLISCLLNKEGGENKQTKKPEAVPTLLMQLPTGIIKMVFVIIILNTITTFSAHNSSIAPTV